jgi:hypothetical protein
LWQARRNVRERCVLVLRQERLAFEVPLVEERKGVVVDYRFAGELKSLPVDL